MSTPEQRWANAVRAVQRAERLLSCYTYRGWRRKRVRAIRLLNRLEFDVVRPRARLCGVAE